MGDHKLLEIEVRELRLRNENQEKEIERLQHTQQQLRQQVRDQDLHEQQLDAMQLRMKKLQGDFEQQCKQEQRLQQELQRAHHQILSDKREQQRLIQQLNRDHENITLSLEEASKIKDELIANLTKEITFVNDELVRYRRENEALQLNNKRLIESMKAQGDQSSLLVDLKEKLTNQEEQLIELDQLRLKIYEQQLVIDRLQQSEKFLRKELGHNQQVLDRHKNQLQKSYDEQNQQINLVKDDYSKKSQIIVKEIFQKEQKIEELQLKLRCHKSLKRNDSMQRDPSPVTHSIFIRSPQHVSKRNSKQNQLSLILSQLSNNNDQQEVPTLNLFDIRTKKRDSKENIPFSRLNASKRASQELIIKQRI